MGIVTNIGQAFLKAQGDWGTAETSFAAANQISCKPILPQFVQEALVAQRFRGGWHSLPIEPGATDGATLQIEHVLQGVDVGTPTSNPGHTPDGLCLTSLLGSSSIYGYTSAKLNSSGQTASLIKFIDNGIASDIVGGPMLVPLVNGTREIAWVKSMADGATEDLTPWNNLTAAADPSGTPVTFGALVAWLSLNQPVPITAQVNLAGDGSACARFRDNVCTSGKIVIVGNQQPLVTWGLRAGAWSLDGSWDVEPYTLYYPELPMLDASNGTRLLASGLTGTVRPKIEIELTNTVVAVRDMAGFRRWETTERAVKITITELIEASGYSSQLIRPGDLIGAVQMDLCTIPGRAASAFLHNGQCKELSKDEDDSGLVVRKTVFDAQLGDGEDAAISSASAIYSPFRFALL